jgi:hypothetical protein
VHDARNKKKTMRRLSRISVLIAAANVIQFDPAAAGTNVAANALHL